MRLVQQFTTAWADTGSEKTSDADFYEQTLNGMCSYVQFQFRPRFPKAYKDNSNSQRSRRRDWKYPLPLPDGWVSEFNQSF